MKTYLVTGAAGFIGANYIKYILAKHNDIKVVILEDVYKRQFQYRVFDAELLNPQELQLTYRAEDGEEGFPGNITCKVVMKLTDDNAIDKMCIRDRFAFTLLSAWAMTAKTITGPVDYVSPLVLSLIHISGILK